jgi:short-subunit dehydrogenase
MVQRVTWQGRTVLITGASSGIGRALALELAAQGADLALCARREERLREVQREVAARGRRALALRCDVTRDGDCDAAVRAAREAFGKLDCAIANAGFGVSGRIDALSIDDFRRQLETNVLGVVRCVHAALPALCETRGQFAVMGSVSSYASGARTGAYAMSKFAVRALADALRGEVAHQGVSVTLINPGFVESEIRQVDNDGAHDASRRETVSSLLLMPAATAARKIARAIDRRRPEVAITAHGALAIWVARHAPWLLRAIAARLPQHVTRGAPDPG